MTWLWLVAALALSAWSLLAVFRAPTLLLFFFSVAATSYGNLMAALSVLVLGANVVCSSVPGIFFSTVAFLLFASPEVRAAIWRRHHGVGRAKFRSRQRIWEKKIEYGDGLWAECFYTEADRPRPLILVVHGGGWVNGHPRDCADFLRALARMGACVVSVKYRLSPGTQWPSQGQDALAGLEEALSRTEEFQIDPQRVFLFGRSAGGQIASAMACFQDRPPIAGCICFYAPFDLIFAYDHGKEDDILRSLELIRQYLGGTPAEARENYLSASAFHQVEKNSPPFLLIHGTRDDLVWMKQSRRLDEKIRQIGGRCVYHELPWATHAFDVNPHGPAARIALAAIQKFIFGDAALASEAAGERN